MANTSFAWINSIFLVMNLLVLAKVFRLPVITQYLRGVIRTLIRKKALIQRKNNNRWIDPVKGLQIHHLGGC